MARRLARPYSARRAEAAFLSRSPDTLQAQTLSYAETLPQAHLSKAELNTENVGVGRRPRILASKSLPGLVIPLQPHEIRLFLTTLGPQAMYGLRAIRLRQECLSSQAGLVFGAYIVPQEIHLYAVPPSPWRLSFVPCRADLDAFSRYASHLRVDTVQRQTCIIWEPNGLRDFFLYVVLAHEIGHHLLQYYRGKRRAQNYRRADHEAWADNYSRRAIKQINPCCYLDRHGSYLNHPPSPELQSPPSWTEFSLRRQALQLQPGLSRPRHTRASISSKLGKSRSHKGQYQLIFLLLILLLPS